MINKQKQKIMYSIIWKGEEVDTAETLQEAKYLQQEYNLAFGGGVTYRKN